MFSRLEGRRVCACKPGYREDRELCLINPDAGQHTGVTIQGSCVIAWVVKEGGRGVQTCIYMLRIIGQTAGPIGLKFLADTQG